MKHKRGVDLTGQQTPSAPFAPARARFAAYDLHRSLSSLAEYEVLGGHCPSCNRTHWLDHRSLLRGQGDMTLSVFEHRLKCGNCGSRACKAMIGILGRN